MKTAFLTLAAFMFAASAGAYQPFPVPSQVAPSFGANTFTGAQTAPSFFGDASGMVSLAAGGTYSPSLAERFGVTKNVMSDFHAACDSTGTNGTDDTAAFNAAVAAAPIVLVPKGATGCKLTQIVALNSNQAIIGIGGSPTLYLTSGSVSQIFNFGGKTNVQLRNLILDGTNAHAGSAFLPMFSVVNTYIDNVVFNNPPGGAGDGAVIIGGTANNVTLHHTAFYGAQGNAAVVLNGTSTNTTIDDWYNHNSQLFGIRCFASSNHNTLTNLRSDLSGLEAVAFSLGCDDNRLTTADVSHSGDNGISIVSNRNSITGISASLNANAGLFVWGAYNAVGTVVCRDNSLSGVNSWPCTGVSGDFGNTGQHNTFASISAVDDQATSTQLLAFDNRQSEYVTWAQTTVYATNGRVVNGLNIYQATTGGTSGSGGGPTCTSGTCSADGSVTWKYLSTFDVQADSLFTQIGSISNQANTTLEPVRRVPIPSETLNTNPDFSIAQQFGSATQSNNTLGGTTIVDGWIMFAAQAGHINYVRNTSSAQSYPFAFTATTNGSASTPSAAQSYMIQSRISGPDLAALGWGTATAKPIQIEIGALMQGMPLGPMAFAITNSAGISYVTSIQPSALSTWENHVVTIPGPTIGSWSTLPEGSGAFITISYGQGSNFQTANTETWQSGGPFYGFPGMSQMVSTAGGEFHFNHVHVFPLGSSYQRRVYADELRQAEAYYAKTFPDNVNPASGSPTTLGQICGISPSSTTSPLQVVWNLPTDFSYINPPPTITTYNPVTPGSATFRDETANTDIAVGTPIFSKNSITIPTAAAVPQGDKFCIQSAADRGL